MLLGGAVPAKLKGTTDDTYYTHYSTISTVEANWKLKNLGRGDVNKTMANVFGFVANATGYTNLNVPQDKRPMTNLTGIFPGPLNANAYVPFTAPADQSVLGAGGQGVLLSAGLNKSFTPSVAPAPVNLTAQGLLVPAGTPPSPSAAQPSAKASGAMPVAIFSSVAAVGAVLAVFSLNL